MGVAYRNVCVTAALLVFLTGSGARSTPAPPRAVPGVSAPEWLDHLKEWSAAVFAHVPGHNDDALITLSAWPADRLTETVGDFFALREVIRRVARAGGSVELEHKKSRLTTEEALGIAALRNSVGVTANGVLRRAAMLHADVALLAAMDMSRFTGRQDTVRTIDGIVVGYESHSTHWTVGRRLLDAVTPAPSADPFVRLWYHAVAAQLLEDGNLAAALPLLTHAVDVLPADANVRYETGFYYQASSAPAIQAVVLMQERAAARVGVRGFGAKSQTSDTETNLKGAERQFREAIALDPAHTEARVRLGHVLVELKRLDDAAIQLRQAVSSEKEGVLGYYARMLLGRAEERLGHRETALECFTGAAALFPDARSPVFARAVVLRARGDRDEAWRLVGDVITPPVADQALADPWWQFYRWQRQSARSLTADLRAMAVQEGNQ